jgi:hypothetical protein
MAIVAPDTAALILDVVHARGTAPATKIVMRKWVADTIVKEKHVPLNLNGDLKLGGVPVELDETIPHFPGFEVVRTVRPCTC